MDRKRYEELINPAIVLVIKKHEDYNALATLASYFPFGDKSYVQMLHVKNQRLLSLVALDSTPNFESKRDTVLDMINYCVFYLDHMDREATK